MDSKLSSLVAGAALLVALAAPLCAQTPPGGPPVLFADSSLSDNERQALTRWAEVVGRWAMVQRIVEAAQQQNDRAVTEERIQEIDRAWREGGNPRGLATELARNECAQALQSLLAVNPEYVDAYVLDARGAVACMGTRPSAYYHGDGEAFRQAIAGGAGAIWVAARARDENLGLDIVRISVPVRSGGRAIGVLSVGRIMPGP